MLPEITKRDNRRSVTLKEFIEIGNKKNYSSEEEWKKSRGFNEEGMNTELSGTFKVNDDGSESWVCRDSSCREILVRDVNGMRAMVRALGNVDVYVKYEEIAAYCPKCHTFNNLMDNMYLTDALADIGNEQQKPLATLFIQDEQRASEQAQINNVSKKSIVRDYLLKLK